MKKVAFIHATLKVKNCLHTQSLVLKTVPVGAFSKFRNGVASETESILEGIIKDLFRSKELSEIVIITSDDACDEPIRAMGSLFQGSPITLTVHAISDQEEYAITFGNMAANDAAWPYVMMPVYGAWHMTGLSVLASHYKADICLVLQADSSLFLDVEAFDQYLITYTTKGIWGTVTDRVRTEFAILNTKFVLEMMRRYGRKIKDMYTKTENKRFLRIDKPLLLAHDDSNMSDIFICYDHSSAPLNSLYKIKDFENSLALHNANFSYIYEKLKNKSFIPDVTRPTFLDIEVIDEQGKMIAYELFDAAVRESGNSLLACNIYVQNKVADTFIDYIACAQQYCSMVMVEFSKKAINSLDLDMIRQYIAYVDLMQFNIDTSVKNDVLTNVIETINQEKKDGRPFVVIRTSPQDIDKYKMFKMLVDRLVIKTSNGQQGSDGTIDFAPFERTACKKLSTSLFINAKGEYAPCRFMKCRTTLQGSVCERFNCEEFMKLRKAHKANDIQEYKECVVCKEWYVPDVVHKLPVNLCFDRKKGVVLHGKDEYDRDKAHAVFQMIKEIREILLSDMQHELPTRELINNVSIMGLYWDLLKVINALFYDIGDILIAHNDVDPGLDAWEHVLQFDPSNEVIHKKLDEMLQDAVNVEV